VQGEGPVVVLIPSLGRGATDFDLLAASLAESGYRTIRPEPRGIGGSALGPEVVTMDDLADDIAAVIRATVDTSPVTATVVGHAFGNRVARMVATRYPELVESVVLLASGGRIPPSAEAASALSAVFDPSLAADVHLAAVRAAFFADGNDPSVWADGWYPETAAIQQAATRATPIDTWWTAGSAKVLVVQPANDVIAVAENAAHIAGQLGDRAKVVTIANAGHALLPEQPAAVAKALLNWLANHRS
jgi:pimeloyl-ACP methyl ester carboxylesterase